jgi:hypothetical protein
MRSKLAPRTRWKGCLKIAEAPRRAVLRKEAAVNPTQRLHDKTAAGAPSRRDGKSMAGNETGRRAATTAKPATPRRKAA